jgi:hypothetical protein
VREDFGDQSYRVQASREEVIRLFPDAGQLDTSD